MLRFPTEPLPHESTNEPTRKSDKSEHHLEFGVFTYPPGKVYSTPRGSKRAKGDFGLFHDI